MSGSSSAPAALGEQQPNGPRWRTQRYELFERLCDLRPEDRILDVGAGWGAALERFNAVNPIVALDLNPITSGWLAQPNVTAMQGDATNLPFADARVRRRVLELRDRACPAGSPACLRVGDPPRRIQVLRPDAEPPLPDRAALSVAVLPVPPRDDPPGAERRFTLGWQEKGHWEQIDLFSSNDIRRLFPDAEIHRERVLGLTKSLIAVRR